MILGKRFDARSGWVFLFVGFLSRRQGPKLVNKSLSPPKRGETSLDNLHLHRQKARHESISNLHNQFENSMAMPGHATIEATASSWKMPLQFTYLQSRDHPQSRRNASVNG